MAGPSPFAPGPAGPPPGPGPGGPPGGGGDDPQAIITGVAQALMDALQGMEQLMSMMGMGEGGAGGPPPGAGGPPPGPPRPGGGPPMA